MSLIYAIYSLSFKFFILRLAYLMVFFNILLQYTFFQHEAGHFLVGYMLGVLPRRYKVPSVEDLLQDKFASGKVEFVGFEFLREVSATIMLLLLFYDNIQTQKNGFMFY